MFTLESFQKKHEVDTSEVVIRGRRFRFLVPRSLDPFVDHENVFHDFPLWAKLWESSLILADTLAGMSPEEGKRHLEIGAGLGLVSIVASTFGHDLTMTEHNPDALEFARANALLNGCPDLTIMDLDWNEPRLVDDYDYILGSEVAYHERNFQALLRLFNTSLKPHGEIILCEGMRKTNVEFFRQMQEHFVIEARKKTLRMANGEVPVILARIRPKACL